MANSVNNKNNLPVAIIHRFPNFSFALSSFNQIINPIETSDPSYPTHRLSTRVLIVVGPCQLKSEHLDQYPSLECVVATSAGVDRFDLAECRRRNIRVASSGSAFSEDGADYAIGLLIDVMRRVSASDQFVRVGLWPVKGEYPLGNTCAGDAFSEDGADYAIGLLIDVMRRVSGSDRYVHAGLWPEKGEYSLGNKLGGKRVGIVGLGSIGTLVAKRLEPFGCTIGYTSRHKKSQFPYAFYPTVLDLAINSDALIVCCSLTEQTHHIINRDVLTALGKRGIIVNIGRGGLVDEKELVKFLVEGELGGAGLDVFENEPEVPKELFTLDNVVLSPHRAITTPESMEALRELVAGNLKAFFSNKPLLSELNLSD